MTAARARQARESMNARVLLIWAQGTVPHRIGAEVMELTWYVRGGSSYGNLGPQRRGGDNTRVKVQLPEVEGTTLLVPSCIGQAFRALRWPDLQGAPSGLTEGQRTVLLDEWAVPTCASFSATQTSWLVQIYLWGEVRYP